MASEERELCGEDMKSPKYGPTSCGKYRGHRGKCKSVESVQRNRDATQEWNQHRRAVNPEGTAEQDYRSQLWRMIRGKSTAVSIFRPALLKYEGPDCQLCLEPLDDKSHVDHWHGCPRHNHLTGKNVYGCRFCVRGLVHVRCNSAVGEFEDRGHVVEGFTADQILAYVTRRPLLVPDNDSASHSI